MPSLSLQIQTRQMVSSTKMFRLVAAVENFYYLLLLSGDKDRAARAETWNSWREMGFHISVKNAPPAAHNGEKIAVDLDIRGQRDLFINVEGGSAAVLGALQSLVKEIDRVRAARSATGDQERLAALKADSAIARQLITSLHSALDKAGCAAARPDFDFAIDRALAVLTHPEILSLQARSQ